MKLERSLIIGLPWIKMILNGDKTWEMRSRKTQIRGPIGLIAKGTGMVVGSANLFNCGEKLSKERMYQYDNHHQISKEMIDSEGFKWFTPWYLENVEEFDSPVYYQHPQGAVTWVDTSHLDFSHTIA